MTFGVPSHCGTEAEFLRHLDELAGPDASRARPDALTIDGPDATGRYTLRLTLRAESRVLEDMQCETLLRTAAVIAVAAVPGHTAGEPPPSTSSPEPPAPAKDPESSAAPPEPGSGLKVLPPPGRRRAESPNAARRGRDRTGARRDPVDPTDAKAPRNPRAKDGGANDPSARQPWQGGLGAGAGLAIGLVPRVGARVEVLGEAFREPWGLRLGLAFVPPSERRLGGRSVSVLAVGGRVAARFRMLRALHLAAGADVDWVRGRGQGIQDARVVGLWMFSPVLELIAVPLDRRHIRLEVSAAGRVAALRPRFEVAGFGTLYETPRFAFLAMIRGVWKIP